MKLTQQKLKQMIKEELNEMYRGFGIEIARSFEKRPEIRKAIETRDIEKIQAEIAELEKEQEEITKLIAMLKNLEK